MMKKKTLMIFTVLVGVSASLPAFAENCGRYAGNPQQQYYCEQNNRQHAEDAATVVAGAVVVGAGVADAASSSDVEHVIGSDGPGFLDRMATGLYHAGKYLQDQLYGLAGPSDSRVSERGDKALVSVSSSSSDGVRSPAVSSGAAK